jgi:hypothetical protein
VLLIGVVMEKMSNEQLRTRALDVFDKVTQNSGWTNDPKYESHLSELVAKARADRPHQDSALADALGRLGELRLEQARYSEAEVALRECLTVLETKLPDWRTFHARSLLGGSLTEQKKYSTAEPLLLAGFDGMKQRAATIPPPGRIRLPEAAARLAELCASAGRPAEAARWRAERAELLWAIAPEPAKLRPPPTECNAMQRINPLTQGHLRRSFRCTGSCNEIDL